MVANTQFAELLEARKARKYWEGRVSSAVEQRFCKPLVGSSILSPGTNKIKDLAAKRYQKICG